MLPDGIPVTVLTAEPTQHPVGASLTAQPAAVRDTVDIIRRMGSQQGAAAGLLECAKVPIGSTYRENCASGPWRSGACIRAIMAEAGVDRRAAEVRLAQCRAAGLLVSPRRGWWGLPGSSAPPAPVAPGAAHQPVVAPTADQGCPPPPAFVKPPVQGVVISAAAPDYQPVVVDAVASCPPAATTATCTGTASPAAFDDLVALVDERAAVMEHDGGMPRAAAEHLARESVLGRDAAPQGAATIDGIVVGVDTPSLVARSYPLVDHALGRFPGVVQLVDDRADPFAGARDRAAPPRPGACRCGHDDWVQVQLHGGRSVRVDCRNCDRFGWFSVWYGRRLAGPVGIDDDLMPAMKLPCPERLSFPSVGAVPVELQTAIP